MCLDLTARFDGPVLTDAQVRAAALVGACRPLDVDARTDLAVRLAVVASDPLQAPASLLAWQSCWRSLGGWAGLGRLWSEQSQAAGKDARALAWLGAWAATLDGASQVAGEWALLLPVADQAVADPALALRAGLLGPASDEHGWDAAAVAEGWARGELLGWAARCRDAVLDGDQAAAGERMVAWLTLLGRALALGGEDAAPALGAVLARASALREQHSLH